MTESALQQKMLDLENEKVPGGQGGQGGQSPGPGVTDSPSLSPGAVQQAEGIPG